LKSKKPVVKRTSNEHYGADMVDAHDDKILLLHLKEYNLRQRLHCMSIKNTQRSLYKNIKEPGL
jgi:hypothetical protein